VVIVTTTVPALPAPSPTAPPDARAPWWPRAALTALLAATAVLYLWGLSRSGWANAFYSAAAQAGGESWKAWFFGSSDAANAITVDKTPAALWVTGLSVRIFGLSSWSILVPQALMGVGAVALLYATVKRVAGPGAGLIAGAALALTPVAVLMFRFNNPDALLVLVLVGAAYATQRGIEKGGTRWLVLAGALVGVGFLAKMLQAFLVVPALAAVWLLAAPVGLGRRVRDLLLAGVAMLVSAGWWVLVVELWPADSRPYIGGSQTNSVLELVFGYNGLGRLTGDETGSVGGSPGGGWGQTGITRLFGSEMGAEASWLLPAALVLLGVLLWRTRRAPRTDPLRAAAVLWGGWLLVTGLVFSYMAGIIHPYYTVALAPAIAALVGLGVSVLWRDRATVAARVTLAVVLALTVGWAWYLLAQTTWQPWLTWTVPVVGLVGVAALLRVHRLSRAAVVGVATVALVAGAGGSTAYALATAATPHTGAIPSAGPSGSGMRGPGGMRGDGRGSPGGMRPPGGGSGFPNGPGTARTDGMGGPGMGGPGGILGSPTPSAELTALLQQDAGAYTWVAAAVGSNNAAGYQLATGDPVMAVGGFNGTDPAPTLAQFQALVAAKKIHYFVGSGRGGSSDTGGSDDATQIAQWVQQHFTATTVGGTTVYDLSAGTTS
jgi:4-amino-4-deoxy-L-arabinose transferase-like glycosyltransferase